MLPVHMSVGLIPVVWNGTKRSSLAKGQRRSLRGYRRDGTVWTGGTAAPFVTPSLSLRLPGGTYLATDCGIEKEDERENNMKDLGIIAWENVPGSP